MSCGCFSHSPLTEIPAKVLNVSKIGVRCGRTATILPSRSMVFLSGDGSSVPVASLSTPSNLLQIVPSSSTRSFRPFPFTEQFSQCFRSHRHGGHVSTEHGAEIKADSIPESNLRAAAKISILYQLSRICQRVEAKACKPSVDWKRGNKIVGLAYQLRSISRKTAKEAAQPLCLSAFQERNGLVD